MKKLPYAVIIFGFVDILFFFPIIWLIVAVLCGISFVYTPPVCRAGSGSGTCRVYRFVGSDCRKEKTLKEHIMKNIPYTGIIYILAVSIILVIPAAIFGLCSLFDFRLMNCPNDPMALGFSFKNAPEGTVRIEPLVKSENGEYISISAYCEELGDTYMRLSGDETPEELQKRLGAFKAAYIDENGNVLGITETARMKYGDSNPRELSADGNALTFTTGSVADWQMAVILIAFLLEPLAVFILIVMIILAIINSIYEKITERKRS